MPHNDINTNPILDQIDRNTAAIDTAPVDTAPISPAASTAPPAPASDSLAAVQEALDISSARIVSNVRALEANVGKTQVATDVITSAISDISSANQIIATAKSNADMQAQNATIDAFEASGGREAQVALTRRLAEDEDRLETLLDERSDILDDEFTGIQIIDGIINEFRSFQTDLEIGAAQGQRNQTVSQIANSTAATESFAKVNAITRKTINEGTIEANLKGMTAASRQEAAKVELENMHSNSSAMAVLINAGKDAVSNLIQSFRLEGEAEQRVVQRETHAFRREKMANDREIWIEGREQREVSLESARLNLEKVKATNPSAIPAAIARNDSAVKAHADNLALEEQIVDSVQRAQSLAGVPIELRETVIFKLNNPNTRDKYVRLQEIGGVPRPVLGLTPADAQENISAIDESGTGTQTAGTKLLKQVMDLQLEKYRQPTVVIPKDIEGRKTDFNNTAKQFTDILAADIKTGDASNPYSAPPMSVLTDKAAVINTPLYQKVLKAKNMQETNPQSIMDAALEGVFAKVITPEEAAAGIEAVFEAAAAHNNVFQGGFERVGLPSQTTYNVKLDRVPTIFETLKALPVLANPFTLPSKIIASEAVGEREFIESQVGAFVTVDLMSETDIQQAIAIIMSTARPIPVPTAAELDTVDAAAADKARSDALKKGIIGDRR